MRREWVVGIGSGLIVAIITALAAKLVPSTPDAGALWRQYSPEVGGVVAGAAWFGAYRLWLIWSRLQRRLVELERQASDQHVAFVFYRELDKQKLVPELNSVSQRVARLEEWKLQGGGDTLGALAHRALQSGIDPKQGGMDIKP